MNKQAKKQPFFHVLGFLAGPLQKWQVPLVWKLSLISLGNLVAIAVLVVVAIVTIADVKQKIDTVQQIDNARLELSQIGDNLNTITQDVTQALWSNSLSSLNNYYGTANLTRSQQRVYKRLAQQIDNQLFVWSDNLTQLLDDYSQLITEMNNGQIDNAHDQWQAGVASLGVRVREDFDNESARLDTVSQNANQITTDTASRAGSLLIDGLTALIVFNILFALLQNLVVATPMAQTRQKLQKLNFDELQTEEISRVLSVPNQDEVGLLISALSQTLIAVQTQKELIYQRTEQLIERLNSDIYQLQTYRDTIITARHDLKTPLGHVKNHAELLFMLEPDLNQNIQDSLHNIIDISNSAVRSLSEVLNKALTDQKAQLNLTKVFMDEIVAGVVRLINTRNLQLETQMASSTAWIDPTIFEHLLLNLINNASHFATSRILIKGSSINYDGSPFYELSIWNDGPSIPETAMESIFQPGIQTALGKQKGGNGLGLYIVKTIVERHNGTVNVANISFPNGSSGVSFTVRVPQPVLEAELAMVTV